MLTLKGVKQRCQETTDALIISIKDGNHPNIVNIFSSNRFTQLINDTVIKEACSSMNKQIMQTIYTYHIQQDWIDGRYKDKKTTGLCLILMTILFYEEPTRFSNQLYLSDYLKYVDDYDSAYEFIKKYFDDSNKYKVEDLLRFVLQVTKFQTYKFLFGLLKELKIPLSDATKYTISRCFYYRTDILISATSSYYFDPCLEDNLKPDSIEIIKQLRKKQLENLINVLSFQYNEKGIIRIISEYIDLSDKLIY